MVIVVSTPTFPYNKSKDVAEIFIEVSKKLQVQKDLEIPILRMVARVTKEEFKTNSITEVKNEKYKEFMKHLSKVQM